jgi:hypothetical protein
VISDTRKNTEVTTPIKWIGGPINARPIIVANICILDFTFVAWSRKCHFAETNGQAHVAARQFCQLAGARRRAVVPGVRRLSPLARICTIPYSMPRKSMPSGFDPMGGCRFSEKDMRQYKKPEHIPIQSNRDVL